jgi:pilus assembly protein CpaB
MKPPAPAPKVVAKQETLQVLVARTDIGLGQIATESNLRWQDWPKDSTIRGFITRTGRPNAIVDMNGAIARVPISAGEPINESKLVRAGQGGILAAILRPGMRAFSIRIKEETAAGRLILPNDHVDVILVRKARSGPAHEDATPETLLRNIRVLAIGQSIETREGKKSAEGATATLEMSPRHTELLAQAGSLGEVTLALRSVADISEESTASSDGAEKEAVAESIRVIRYGVKSRAYSVN